MRVIIAAAGTAGHINPGIAIANKIKEKNKNAKIIFIGTTRGLENDLVPKAGYELKTIDAYGLSKKVSIENLRKIIKTFKGIGQAKKIIAEFKPDIVIGMGGYICGAVIIAAKKDNIPTILHESNAFPGKAVKMLLKRTDKVLVGFEEAKERLQNSDKVIVTGNPSKIKKRQYSETDRKIELSRLKLDGNSPVVLIFGGSQGAKKINDAVLEIIKNKCNKNYQIIWAPGPTQYDGIKETLQENGINIQNIKGVKIEPYIYDMEKVMNLADLVVARSGALTITEIAVVGKPAIFVPLPNVSENHQEYNAKVLANKNAAKIIKNEELTGEVLNKQIEELIKDKNKLTEMGNNANTIAKENVEEKIYYEIETLIKEHP